MIIDVTKLSLVVWKLVIAQWFLLSFHSRIQPILDTHLLITMLASNGMEVLVVIIINTHIKMVELSTDDVLLTVYFLLSVNILFIERLR